MKFPCLSRQTKTCLQIPPDNDRHKIDENQETYQKLK